MGTAVLRILWLALVGVLYLFLLAPILIGVVVSFTSGPGLGFPPPGWSLQWYQALLQNPDYVSGLETSLLLAVGAVAGALLLGIPVAVAATHGRDSRQWILNLFTLPLIVPGVILGLGLLLALDPLGLVGGMPALLGAHLLVTTPFVIRIVAGGLQAIAPEYEEAAVSLGASPAVAFFRVTVPLMIPSVVAAGAIAFIISMGETALTLFVATSDVVPLPIVMYRDLLNNTTPTLAAASVALMALALIAVLLAQRGLRALGGAPRI